MNTIGVGVIGCGFVGRGAHVPALSEMKDATLIAVADPDSNRLNKAADKYKIKSRYQDYTDLVADPDVQAVIVATPTPLHAEVSMAAIKAGKHVLCEMPLAPTLDEIDQLAGAADKAGVYLMPGLTFRFTPNYVKAKEMLGKGVLGEPTAVFYREFIAAADLARQWPAGSWVWDVDQSGGPLFTLSVWSIDLVRWLFDTEIAETNAVARYIELEQFGGTLGYDACATLRLANGVVACMQYSGSVGASASVSRLEAVGSSNCLLSAEDNERLTLLGEDPARTEWDLKEPGARSWGHYQQDAYFVECIRTGQAPQIGPDDARHAIHIAHAIARSDCDQIVQSDVGSCV